MLGAAAPIPLIIDVPSPRVSTPANPVRTWVDRRRRCRLSNGSPLRADRCHNGRLVQDHAPDLSALVVDVRRGDHAAFGRLYDALAPLVFGVVKRVVRDPAMSEEVTQEVFSEIWTTATRFDESRASVAGWATMIARRRAIDRVRSEQSHRNRVDAVVNDRPEAAPMPEAIVTDRDEAVQVHAAIAGLPAEQREVVTMAFIEGCTHQEISDRLGVPLGTVKGRARLALKRLRVALGDHP